MNGEEWWGGVAFTYVSLRSQEGGVGLPSQCLHLVAGSEGDRLPLDANVQSCHERWAVQRQHLNNPHETINGLLRNKAMGGQITRNALYGETVMFFVCVYFGCILKRGLCFRPKC